MGTEIRKRFVFGLWVRLYLIITVAACLTVRLNAGPHIQLPDGIPDTLIVGSEPDYPPYCILNERKEADGFSVDLFRAVAKAAGFEVRFVVRPWDQLKKDLAQGRIHALPLVGRTQDREPLFDFTIPYLTMHGTVVVREADLERSTLKDLEGKKIAIMKGDNVEEFLLRIRQKSILIALPTYREALSGLSRGLYDAVVIQKLVAIELIKKFGFDNLKDHDLPKDQFEQKFCIAVTEGDSELLGLLNEGLSTVFADGTYQKIRDLWFAPEEDIEYGRSRIIIGGDDNYPPYEFLDENGQPAGFNVDLAKAIATEMGLQIDIMLAPWAEVLNGLEEGQIDAIAGMFYSSEREKSFDFSPPHNLVSQVFVYRKGDSEPESINRLQDKSVVVQAGDIMHDLILKNGNPRSLIVVPNQVEALKLLAAGTGDCALVARTQALYYIERNKYKNLVISEKPLILAEYCFSVRHGRGQILDVLNEGLNSVKATGEYRKIYARWLGVLDKPEFGLLQFVKYSSLVVVPLVLLLIGSMAWSRSLQSRVIRRTEKLRESEEKLRQLAENSRQVFWLTDWINKKLLYVSTAYEELYGMSVESAYLDRMAWKKPIHPDDIARVDKIFNDSRDHEIGVEAEYRIIRPDGEVRWVYDRSYPIFNEKGSLVRFVSIAEDITTRKLTEIQLQDTIAELGQAKERAEESDRLKSAFLANMSHEIRTPMNGIIGFAELLEDPHLNDEEQKKYLSIIQQSGERMLSLINDLIDISKIEAGQVQLNIQEVDPNRIMAELYEFFLPEANRKGLSLSMDSGNHPGGCTLFTDKTKLNQVLVNLIKNSIKFTFQGGINFGYRCLPSNIEFFVSDSGIGISQENKKRIFDRFSREATGKIREVEGAGLGLSISKAYIELLGGHIRVESELENGSTFFFALPYTNETPVAPASNLD